jgi:hypothetical protein
MSTFKLLFREFFSQFFESESVTSDLRLRQALIAVVAFLMAPGMILAIQMYPTYQDTVRSAPELVDPLTRQLTSLFLTFSTVSIGLVSALAWAALSFDRRDAMVLGPLPVSRAMVVAAKVTALVVFLLGACLPLNLVTAVPFSLVASGHKDLSGVAHHFIAHMVTTTCAASWVFSAIVILRGLLGMTTRGYLASALASLLQVVFVSALLCFFVLAPTMLTIDRRPQNAGITISEIHMTVMPAWMPTRWFLPMYEQLRGTADPGMGDVARRTAITTLAMVAGAIMITVAGYRRQLQLALTPPASTGAIGRARISRAVARAMLGPDRVAQAVCDFVLATITRNRTQQAPIAINAAIGLAMLILGIARQRGGIAAAVHAPVLVLAAPLVLVFWTSIGIRASFFVPSELPASWSFRANATAATSAYALGTRAAIVALVGPPAVLAALALATLVGGWLTAVFHASFVLLLVVALADFVVLTIGDIPFTRPYKPGHAKLKTRWPLYFFGAYGFGNGLASLELLFLNEPHAFVAVLMFAAMVVAAFEWAVRRAGRDWPEQSGDDGEEALSSVTVLNLASAVPRQV